MFSQTGVPVREFRSVSPSQLYDFRACRRLWWFKSVLGVETPQRASAALGTEVHAHLQRYLDDGTRPPDTESGRIARAGLSLLPEPGTVFTEVKIKDEERAWPRPHVIGVPVNGIVDVLGLAEDPPLVLDHKSSSDMKWAKTEAELLEDPQGIIYGRFALGAVESMGVAADRVTFGHVVYLTRGGPFARKTTVTLAREHIDSLWERSLEPDVREMKDIARVTAEAQVPGNRESCDAYGGCHFRDRCRALGTFSGSPVPAFIARAAGLPLTPPAAPDMSGVHTLIPPPEIPVTTTPATIDPMAALKAMQARRAAASNAQSPTGTPAPGNPAQPTPPPADTGSAGKGESSGDAKASILDKYGIKPTGAGEGAATPGASGIVPPDAPPQVSRLASGTAGTGSVTVVGTGTLTVTGEAGKAGAPRKPPGFAAKLAALHWTPEQVARMLPDAMRAAIDGKLDGRGYSVRNDGSIYEPGKGEVAGKPEEPETTRDASGDVKHVEPEQPSPAARDIAALLVEKAAENLKAPGLVLYIDCVPCKGRDGDYQRLEELVQPLLPVAVEQHNRAARDDEKVDFYGLIPYNRGPSYVAKLLLARPPTGAVACDTRMPVTSACLEVLLPLAHTVVRASR